MRHFLATGFLAGFLIAGSVFLSEASAQRGPATATVWDGMYSSVQANRGQDVYDTKCVSCHQSDLTGGGDEAAAVLRGPDFFAQWNNKSVGDLFRAISENMPMNAPGSLDASAVADLVSFLLKKNQIPAGDTALPTDLATLDGILITDKPR